ncbi:DUF2157 domain-containing protein [Alteromonas sp. a30]|uniref:DUF2157 domain-containing protein n=1 Tax=Alteromonas sp. a30 TaxID=2730917 RepID=UPI00227FC442|nr:DUF2157 domain-containing protein [Alteromonas sp. a30]MCY7295117.1 DUF2157 domain-containing protein [Alteromonas sp. a30]
MEENPVSNKANAQLRVDQIHAFQRELAELEKDDILALPAEKSRHIERYHQQLLATLTASHDVDTNDGSKQLTLGMKIASLFGALAMAASVFFLFYQFWGHFSTGYQVGILVLVPLILFIVSLHLSQKEKSAYFSKIAAVVSFSCFVLNLSMLGKIFNISPSPNALIVWAAFAFLLAYAVNARLLLFFAIMCCSGFIAMKFGTWSGMYWIDFGERPENFFLASLFFFWLPVLVPTRRFIGFDTIYRVLAMIMLFLPILILSNYGAISYIRWSSDVIEGLYQVVGFALALLSIWAGIKQRWREVVNTGTVFFVLFMYTKFFDWWWDWMPKYVFFFLLGLSALLALMVFKRLRLNQLSEGVAK